MNTDCITWKGCQLALKQVTGIKAFAQVDKVNGQISELAVAIVADPRRLQAVSKDCPALVAEIRARAQAAGAPPPPDHLILDAAAASRWVASLTPQQVTLVEAALAEQKSAVAKPPV